MPAQGEESWKQLWHTELKEEILPQCTHVGAVATLDPVSSSHEETITTFDDVEVDKEKEVEDSALEKKNNIAPRIKQQKLSVYSDLSIMLTIISILVAFAISAVRPAD